MEWVWQGDGDYYVITQRELFSFVEEPDACHQRFVPSSKRISVYNLTYSDSLTKVMVDVKNVMV